LIELARVLVDDSQTAKQRHHTGIFLPEGRLGVCQTFQIFALGLSVAAAQPEQTGQTSARPSPDLRAFDAMYVVGQRDQKPVQQLGAARRPE
jgi:hypothetical protein